MIDWQLDFTCQWVHPLYRQNPPASIVSIPPKYAVLEFMGYVKGKLATRLFQECEKLGRKY